MGPGERARSRHPGRPHRLGEGVRGDVERPPCGLGVVRQDAQDLAPRHSRLLHHASRRRAILRRAATATVIVAGDTAGSTWFLDVPPSFRNPKPSAARDEDYDQRAPRRARGTRGTRSTMSTIKHTILFLAA